MKTLLRLFRALAMLALCAAFLALGLVAIRTARETPKLASVGAPSRPVVVAIQPPRPEVCGEPATFAAAASDNAGGLMSLPVAPTAVAETGWAAYAPLVAREIATSCGPETAAFAGRLAAWQSTHALASSGRMDAATLSAMSVAWLRRRPFVLASQKGCPASPAEASLAKADPVEAYGGKTVLARPGALAAYRRMAEAARQALGPDAPQLKIASAYRGPIEEAVRCALGGCGTPGRARCSAHRTGLAFDFYLGAAPGEGPFSSAAANRLFLARSPTYLWLVANADRFGFVNYAYEPWHWEWTGEPV